MTVRQQVLLWEKQAIVAFHLKNPLEGYRRLTFMGTGGFTKALGSPFKVGFGPVSVAVGDLNGDGTPYLAIANDGSDNVTVLLNSY